jgi:antitoxin ParD1/3/4
MSKNTSFSIGEHFAGFVEAQVREGRYTSASDVVRAGLRLLEEHEAKLAALRTALVEGEQSGDSDQTVDDIWNTVKEKQATGMARG